jgi:hypothetical protein
LLCTKLLCTVLICTELLADGTLLLASGLLMTVFKQVDGGPELVATGGAAVGPVLVAAYVASVVVLAVGPVLVAACVACFCCGPAFLLGPFFLAGPLFLGAGGA